MIYTPVDLVNVFLGNHKVGRLALVKRRIYFEYEPTFITAGLEISPFKLPLKIGAVPFEDSIFEGLFGVFNDSLPDGWGRLLLDRQVRRHGMAPEQLTPLDRLTHVGQHGMGALSYEPDVNTPNLAEEVISLDHLAQASAQALEGEADEIFPELLALSASSAGARPKVMVGVNENRTNIIHGQQQLPEGYQHWMVKFASSSDLKDIGAVEYAYSLMAKAAGIEMPETHLFLANKGAGYFGVQRFDRIANERIHMHSLAGLVHADHRLPSLDYEIVLRATFLLTKRINEVAKMFRLATFNVLAHNRDDHAKNFAYLMLSDGTWQASLAYDLTFSSGPGGEQSSTVMGEGKNPGVEHLLALAKKFDIEQAQPIIDEVQSAIFRWTEFADEAGVSTVSKRKIRKIIL